MKILIADKFSEAGIQQMLDGGHIVYYDAALKDASLTEALQMHRPQVLVVRSTKVTAAMMDVDPALELVVRAGAGYDTIDVSAASDRGIFVANCPGKNAVAVAELAFGLILAIDRNIPENVQELRSGKWDKARFSKAEGIKGKTLGVIGMGNIGQEVVKRAKAFGMPVVAWSRSLTGEKASELGVEFMHSPEDVAHRADVISLHVASNPDTQDLVDREFLSLMKPGAILVNTTRGAVVDEEALLEAIGSKGIRVGLDVYRDEPQAKTGEFRSKIANHPAVYGTHHIGASTEQAAEAIGNEALRVITVFAESGQVPNCVNMEKHSPATHLITVRHLDKVGVLAAILEEMRSADWNVQEMENLIFEGARAACARIRFNGEVSDNAVKGIESNPNVLAVSLIEL